MNLNRLGCEIVIGLAANLNLTRYYTRLNNRCRFRADLHFNNLFLFTESNITSGFIYQFIIIIGTIFSTVFLPLSTRQIVTNLVV